MPKEKGAEVWAILKRHVNQGSVAKIPKGPEQLAEIERRCAALAEDMAGVGVAVTPVAVKAALGVPDEVWERWSKAKAKAPRDERGNQGIVELDKAALSEENKQYIRDRASIIKKWLLQGELMASSLVQAQDNRENGGVLHILQHVYGYGQDKGKEQITFSLEDLLQAAAAVKERRGDGPA